MASSFVNLTPEAARAAAQAIIEAANQVEAAQNNGNAQAHTFVTVGYTDGGTRVALRVGED